METTFPVARSTRRTKLCDTANAVPSPTRAPAATAAASGLVCWNAHVQSARSASEPFQRIWSALPLSYACRPLAPGGPTRPPASTMRRPCQVSSQRSPPSPTRSWRALEPAAGEKST